MTVAYKTAVDHATDIVHCARLWLVKLFPGFRYCPIKQILFLCIHPYPLPQQMSLYQQEQLLPPHLNALSSSLDMLSAAGTLQVFTVLATEARIWSFSDMLRQ